MTERSDARPLVLVVEDDADLRAYLARGLGDLARVAEAPNGLDALAVLAAEPVALVVTDLSMPRMDGLALCRAMQADAALASVPILIITGEAAPDIPSTCGTLRKPFNARDLQRRVAPYLHDAVRPAPPTSRHLRSDVSPVPSSPNS